MEKRAEVFSMLMEGAGIRTTHRLTSVSQNAILSLLLKVGCGYRRLHNRLVRGLDITYVELDELHSFVHTRQKNLKPSAVSSGFGARSAAPASSSSPTSSASATPTTRGPSLRIFARGSCQCQAFEDPGVPALRSPGEQKRAAKAATAPALSSRAAS